MGKHKYHTLEQLVGYLVHVSVAREIEGNVATDLVSHLVHQHSEERVKE